MTTTIPTPAGTPSRHAERHLPRPHPSVWLLTLLGVISTAATTLRARASAARADETGNVITDNLAWIVFGVVAIVAIGALIKALGGTVLNWVQTQLGI